MGVRVVRLPIHARESVASDGTRRRDELVFCPARRRTIDASDCYECASAMAISPTAVECSPPMAGLHSEDDASTVSVGAVASGTFKCVDGELSAKAIRPLLPREPWALPVVDTAGHFRGFISRRSLGETGLPPRLSSTMRVGDLAVGHALAIDERCSLREAVEALALRHARAIAVVDSEGTVRGLLTDIEALRAWITRRRAAP